MISRKLLAALVGLSLAAGTLGSASAQTTDLAAKPAPAAAATTAPVKKAHHGPRMHKATHRKHLAHRAGKGTKVAAKPATKRIHVSRAAKHTTKHV